MGEIFGRGLAYGLGTDRADNWRDRAACLSGDPERFFPVGTSGPALDQTNDAKRVCARCPVAAACLRWAMDTGQDHGVWGGLSEEERRALRESRATPAGLPRLCLRCPDLFTPHPDFPTAVLCPRCSNADAVHQRKRRAPAGAR